MKYHTISYHIITFFHLAYIFSIESDKNGPNEISMHITTSIRPCGSAVGIWINIQRSVIKKPNLPIYNAAVQVLLKHVEFQNLHNLISNFQNCQYNRPAVSRLLWSADYGLSFFRVSTDSRDADNLKFCGPIGIISSI
mgnify:CR=1 FL=1